MISRAYARTVRAGHFPTSFIPTASAATRGAGAGHHPAHSFEWAARHVSSARSQANSCRARGAGIRSPAPTRVVPKPPQRLRDSHKDKRCTDTMASHKIQTCSPARSSLAALSSHATWPARILSTRLHARAARFDSTRLTGALRAPSACRSLLSRFRLRIFLREASNLCVCVCLLGCVHCQENISRLATASATVGARVASSRLGRSATCQPSDDEAASDAALRSAAFRCRSLRMQQLVQCRPCPAACHLGSGSTLIIISGLTISGWLVCSAALSLLLSARRQISGDVCVYFEQISLFISIVCASTVAAPAAETAATTAPTPSTRLAEATRRAAGRDEPGGADNGLEAAPLSSTLRRAEMSSIRRPTLILAPAELRAASGIETGRCARHRKLIASVSRPKEWRESRLAPDDNASPGRQNGASKKLSAALHLEGLEQIGAGRGAT